MQHVRVSNSAVAGFIHPDCHEICAMKNGSRIHRRADVQPGSVEVGLYCVAFKIVYAMGLRCTTLVTKL